MPTEEIRITMYEDWVDSHGITQRFRTAFPDSMTPEQRAESFSIQFENAKAARETQINTPQEEVTPESEEE